VDNREVFSSFYLLFDYLYYIKNMAKFRAPLHISVITPQLTVAQLQTLAADLPTLLNTAGNFTITCGDQLNAATMTIQETYQENKTQCAEAPINKTKTGLNAMAEISIAEDRMDLFSLAVNGTNTNATPVVAASSITSGSPNITSAALYANVNVGDAVTGTGIPVGTTVLTRTSSSAITLSANATVTNASASLTFTPTIPSLIRIGDQAGATQGVEIPFRTIVFRPLAGNTPTTQQSRWIIFPSAAIEGDMQSSYGLDQQFEYKLKMNAYDPFERGYKVLRGLTSLLT
jgi:hypothetical protein